MVSVLKLGSLRNGKCVNKKVYINIWYSTESCRLELDRCYISYSIGIALKNMYEDITCILYIK